MINEDPASFAETLQEDGIFLLDVRTPEEFLAGHISGATLIDYNDASFEIKIADLDPSLTYAVYCRSGKRSLGAIELLNARGIIDIHHLKDGIMSWVWAGQPTTEASSN